MEKPQIDVNVAAVINGFTSEDLEIFVPQVKAWYKKALRLLQDSAKQAASAGGAVTKTGVPATDSFKAELAELQETPYLGVNGEGGLFNEFPSLTPKATADALAAEAEAQRIAELAAAEDVVNAATNPE